MNQDYPLRPEHLDTLHEPKGFDTLLNYSQRVLLWAFVQFWQSRGNWESFTHEEFIAFISNKNSRVNPAVKSGLIWLPENELKSMLQCYSTDNEPKGPIVYNATHFMISTYFLWNPAT